jgi:predicted nuclease with TOPRIM domain
MEGRIKEELGRVERERTALAETMGQLAAEIQQRQQRQQEIAVEMIRLEGAETVLKRLLPEE